MRTSTKFASLYRKSLLFIVIVALLFFFAKFFINLILFLNLLSIDYQNFEAVSGSILKFILEDVVSKFNLKKTWIIP